MKQDVLGVLDFVVGITILASIPAWWVIEKLSSKEREFPQMVRIPLQTFPHAHPEGDNP